MEALLLAVKYEFQFTPLREGRRSNADCLRRCLYFNSRPSARGDADAQSVQESADISIHAPPRGATRHTQAQSSEEKFQFTPLREGRRVPLYVVKRPHNFNSRPSARGDRH